MWHRLQDLWTHNRKHLLAFIAVLGVAGYFGARSVADFVYWSDPAKLEQPLAGWMTPRYVGRSYQVPREVMQDAFKMTPGGQHRRISLYRLAEENGMSLDEMQARLDAAVAAWRAEQRP